MKVLYTNVDQFLNKRDDLLMFIAGDEPDLILITEILPKVQSSLVTHSLLSIPGYTVFLNFECPSSHHTTSQRGVGIYVLNSIPTSRLNFSSIMFEEQLWLSLNLKGCDVLTIDCIYCSPSLPPDTSTHMLCNLMKTAIGKSHFLLCGDFNYPGIDWVNMTCDSSYTWEFIDTVQDLYLYQHITEPTRYKNGQTPHILVRTWSSQIKKEW